MQLNHSTIFNSEADAVGLRYNVSSRGACALLMRWSKPFWVRHSSQHERQWFPWIMLNDTLEFVHFTALLILPGVVQVTHLGRNTTGPFLSSFGTCGETPVYNKRLWELLNRFSFWFLSDRASSIGTICSTLLSRGREALGGYFMAVELVAIEVKRSVYMHSRKINQGIKSS